MNQRMTTLDDLDPAWALNHAARHAAPDGAAPRTAAQALFLHVSKLSDDLKLRIARSDESGLIAVVPGFDLHFAALEWGASTRRWSSILRLQGPYVRRHVAVAIVPRNDMRAASTAHAGHADAVVWHDDAIGMERALARLLPLRAAHSPEASS